jgi:hypothetical protein
MGQSELVGEPVADGEFASDDAVAGGDAGGPEDLLLLVQPATITASRHDRATTRIGLVCRSVLKRSLCARPDRLLSRADRVP